MTHSGNYVRFFETQPRPKIFSTVILSGLFLNHPLSYMNMNFSYELRIWMYLELKNCKVVQPFSEVNLVIFWKSGDYDYVIILTVRIVVKSKRKISQNFVAFSEYMNFIAKLMPNIWHLTNTPILKMQSYPLGMLIFRQRSFKFCIPAIETP